MITRIYKMVMSEDNKVVYSAHKLSLREIDAEVTGVIHSRLVSTGIWWSTRMNGKVIFYIDLNRWEKICSPYSLQMRGILIIALRNKAIDQILM